MDNIKKAEWVLRIGVAGEFLGHGVFALGVKQGWIPYFTNLGLTEGFAGIALPLIGIMDIVVALIVLVKPYNFVLGWATIWGFWTALLRPVSGGSWWDFIERFANWAAPLALIYLRGFPKNWKDWFK
ncbi:hypothetical protein CL617_02165 [archaeon]|nr:hypothetical protein [archaeon]|tara:strand:+ start:6601 stop:6981 length:381 start_codon:yes stop_codon:yes gene_type:complete